MFKNQIDQIGPIDPARSIIQNATLDNDHPRKPTYAEPWDGKSHIISGSGKHASSQRTHLPNSSRKVLCSMFYDMMEREETQQVNGWNRSFLR
jgi:hypothetical protein